jgi:hypothetical protein
MHLSHSNSRLVLIQPLQKNTINSSAIKIIVNQYILESHPPNSLVHPLARILQIINNGLPPIFVLTYISFKISGQIGGLRFSLAYVSNTKHRLLRDVKHAAMNVIAGCLLLDLGKFNQEPKTEPNLVEPKPK